MADLEDTGVYTECKRMGLFIGCVIGSGRVEDSKVGHGLSSYSDFEEVVGTFGSQHVVG